MIGVFDSGLGGMSVLNELLKAWPAADFCYLGDTARVPYGTRSTGIIREYCAESRDYLVAQGVSIMIVACNTASAVALDIFESARLPVVDVIRPTVRGAVAVGLKRLAVIGTSATVESHLYKKLLLEAGVKMVREVACPLFVSLVEEGFENHPATRLIAEEYLKDLIADNPEALIFGCTHYPFLVSVIGAVMGEHTQLITSGQAVVNELRRRISFGELQPDTFAGSGQLLLRLTDIRGRTQDIARRWLVGKNFVCTKAELKH